MFKLLLNVFLWWWPKLPGPVRYSISGAIIVGAVIGWIFVSEAWVVWVVVMMIGGSMMMYGEPSDSEKRGYRF